VSETTEVISADEFTPYEQQLAERISAAGRRSSNLDEVALALGGAFLLYRTFVRRRLKEETRENLPAPEALQELATRIFRLYVPKFVAVAAPALMAGYYIGLREAGTTRPSDAWVADSANSYANSLGTSIHNVSTQALIQGVQAQINRRVATRVAIDRTIDAFGVTPRTMKSLVNIWLAPPPEKAGLTSQKRPNVIADRVDYLLARAIQERAATIGDTEAHLSSNAAKALYWSYQAHRGEISPLQEKEWITADDERVCPTCGPMHHRRVLVNELFTLPDGSKILAPSSHPRCRCRVVLVMSEQARLDSYNTKDRFALAKSAFGVVHKAVGGDPFDRDRNGRFATSESRNSKPRLKPVARARYKEPEVDFSDPRVSAILNQAADMLKTPEPIRAGEARIKAGEPRIKAGGRIKAGEKISAGGKITAGGVAQEKIELAPIKLSNKLALEKVRAKAADIRVSGPAEDFDEDNFASESDVWINSPNGEPIYAVLGPDDWGDGDTVMTDEFTPFYTVAKGMAHQALQQAVIDHWDAFLHPDNIHDEFQSMSHHEESIGENVVSYIQGDMRLHVTVDAFEVALVESAHGLTRRESEDVLIHAEQEGPDGWTFAEISVPAYDVAQNLGLHLLVSDNTPVIARANKINATHYDEHAWGRMLTNPGKWKVLSSDIGSVSEWASRDQRIPLPYHMYDIDPLDLYPD